MRQSPRRASLPHRRRRQVAPPAVEVLERREVLSLIFDFGHDADHHHEEDMIGPPSAELKSADARPVGGSSGPQIRLELVALHEFGHSLGLDHNDKDGPSIMNSYYNPNYDLNSFPQDPAIDTLINLFANVNTSPWNDVSDNDNGATDGDVDLTYSFIPNGVATDSRRNTTNTFATFDRIFGAGNWQHIFGDALNLWASASNGKLSFSSHADYGRPFNYRGAAQNDPRAGDIRIGSHYFDGPGRVLSHAYFPPPNGSTAAGNAHFDSSENWTYGLSAPAAVVSAASGSLAPIARKTLGQKLSPPSRNLLLSPEASALREVDSVAANLVLGTLDLLDETESLVKPGARKRAAPTSAVKFI